MATASYRVYLPARYKMPFCMWDFIYLFMGLTTTWHYGMDTVSLATEDATA